MPQPLLRAVPGRGRSERGEAFEGQDRAGFGVAAVEVDGELEEPVVEFFGVDEGLLDGPASRLLVGKAAEIQRLHLSGTLAVFHDGIEECAG